MDFKGTLRYMAPEMIRGDNICVKYDIWSVGIIFYQLLTWKQLFQGAFNKVIQWI